MAVAPLKMPESTSIKKTPRAIELPGENDIKQLTKLTSRI